MLIQRTMGPHQAEQKGEAPNARHHGISVSPGIAIGPAYFFQPLEYEIAEAHCTAAEKDEQLQLFEKAHAAALDELDAIFASFDDVQKDKAEIFRAHKELLQDDALLGDIRDGISSKLYTAECAVDMAFREYIALFAEMEDPLFSGRAADLRDLRSRLLRLLRGDEQKSLRHLPGSVILVVHDLLPSDTATLDREHVLGIVAEIGGATSHSAIIARGLNIPAVLGAADALSYCTDGGRIILDAMSGVIITAPDSALVEEYRVKRSSYLSQRATIQKYLDTTPVTRDGVRIEIGLNTGSDAVNDYEAYVDYVGLFRSEFLYMQSNHLPTEEEQFEAYRRVVARFGNRPVILRTLDIGGDKQLSYYQLPKEENPYLGKRALRLCISDESILRTQLRAAYRAAAYGNLELMLPMVGSMDDIDYAKSVAKSVREELTAEGVVIGEMPLGIMVEIPSIAMIADLAAAEVDFASIGTNDLTQYLCAADRLNADVSAFYQPLSPAMLRTLKRVIDAFRSAGKPVSVCGEMGGDVRAALLLVGLGLRKLSMSGSSIAEIKAMLAQHTIGEMEAAAERALACRTEAEVIALVDSLL